MRIAAWTELPDAVSAVIRIGRRHLSRHAPAAGFDTGRRPGEAVDRFGGEAPEAEGQQFDRTKVHPFAQGIARLQKTDDLVGERLNDGDLEPKPEIPDFPCQRLALVEQDSLRAASDCRHCSNAGAACASPNCSAEAPLGRQRITRKIDAVEISEVLAAVLKVIVDLQAGAQRVRRHPGRRAFAVNVEHEPADRHRRIPAVINHFVPCLIDEAWSRPCGKRSGHRAHGAAASPARPAHGAD